MCLARQLIVKNEDKTLLCQIDAIAMYIQNISKIVHNPQGQTLSPKFQIS